MSDPPDCLQWFSDIDFFKPFIAIFFDIFATKMVHHGLDVWTTRGAKKCWMVGPFPKGRDYLVVLYPGQ